VAGDLVRWRRLSCACAGGNLKWTEWWLSKLREKIMKPETLLKLSYLFTGSVVVFLLYLVVSLAAYRLRNPELTDTQLFLKIPAALQWK
jgi:hypothetical protein